MTLNTGLNDNQRKKIASALARILADTHVLYLKTHGYHWNVTGPHFQSLHTLFEEQYTELFEALDELAERIRALGEFAPGSTKQFLELATLSEDPSVPDANAMLTNLVQDNEALVRSLRSAIEEAEEAGDAATADLLTERLDKHEQAAWMLRSSLS